MPACLRAKPASGWGALDRFLASVDVPSFTEAITLRLGLLIVVMSLQTYSDIIRGADRAVFDPHPMDINQYFSATCWRLLRTKLLADVHLVVWIIAVG